MHGDIDCHVLEVCKLEVCALEFANWKFSTPLHSTLKVYVMKDCKLKVCFTEHTCFESLCHENLFGDIDCHVTCMETLTAM